MPATYRIDPTNKIVLSTATGTFTAADAWDQIEQLHADPQFSPSFGQLLDFIAVVSIKLTPAEIKRLAEAALFSPASNRAFVSPTPLLYGLSRMYAAQREVKGDTGIGVFRTLVEARVWLGLEKIPAPV